MSENRPIRLAPRSGLLSGPSRSANGTAAAKPFTHTRSRSICRSRWEEVEVTPTKDIAHRTSLFPWAAVVESRKKKKTFSRPLQDVRVSFSRYSHRVSRSSCRCSSLTFYIRIEVSYAHTYTRIHTHTHTHGTGGTLRCKGEGNFRRKVSYIKISAFPETRIQAYNNCIASKSLPTVYRCLLNPKIKSNYLRIICNELRHEKNGFA